MAMEEALRAWAERRGHLVGWGPARALLEQVRADLERRGAGDRPAADEALDPGFARENLAFDYDCAGLDEGILLIVCAPRPAHLVGFETGGRRVDVVMPPTYYHYRPTFEHVRRDLAANALSGYRVATVAAPLKLLAARLGLVRYGRNNLAYAPAFGSYMQLLGYVTDAPLEVPEGWNVREPALLDECDGCGVCAALCPTAAIPEDRTLLRAERCLTLANEAEGPWPAHVPAAAHHCLIGCLLCQQDCPANPPLPVEDSGVAFTERETRALLEEGDHSGSEWDGIRRRLEALGRPYQEPVIGRNLRAFLLGVQVPGGRL